MACRVCTTNDRDALVEELAKEFWEGESVGATDDRTWEQAGSYWQILFRQYAARALVVMERGR